MFVLQVSGETEDTPGRRGNATERSQTTLLDTDTGTVDRSVIISVTCEELQVETIRSRRGLQGIMGI